MVKVGMGEKKVAQLAGVSQVGFQLLKIAGAHDGHAGV
jgi:hypothetical protein